MQLDTLPEQHDKIGPMALACRNSFRFFVRKFWDEVPGAQPVRWNWHMDVLCDELEEAAERVFKGEQCKHDYVINVPPGTSKSTICSVMFPAWVWTRMPTARFITASHTDSLVSDLAAKSRDLIQGDLYRTCFSEVEIRGDKSAVGLFRNTKGGDRLACTVAGKSPMGFPRSRDNRR